MVYTVTRCSDKVISYTYIYSYCDSNLKIPVGIFKSFLLYYPWYYYLGGVDFRANNRGNLQMYKKGDKSNIENYRLISLTSLVMKVMEKHVRDEIYSRCWHLISEKQHGFLPQKSCTTQLVTVLNDICHSMNSRNDVDVIYFDFAKAFDTVCHDVILHKLKHRYNINGLMLNFIRSYLQDRLQRLVIHGSFSDTVSVNSGVPQGSILGPLLFVLLLFINDIYKQISPGTSIALYADDTKMWRRILSYADCEILNRDIDAMYKWATANKMKFHSKKCKVLSVSLKRPNYYFLPFHRFSYELDNDIIEYVTEQIDLGVTLTNRMTWERHHDKIITKANRQLGMIRRTCHSIKNIA